VTDLSTKNTIPPDDMLTAAVGQLDTLILIGVKKDGGRYYVSSHGSGVALAEMALATSYMAASTRKARGW